MWPHRTVKVLFRRLTSAFPVFIDSIAFHTCSSLPTGVGESWQISRITDSSFTILEYSFLKPFGTSVLKWSCRSFNMYLSDLYGPQYVERWLLVPKHRSSYSLSVYLLTTVLIRCLLILLLIFISWRSSHTPVTSSLHN